MSALDKAVAELEAKRAREEAERRARQEAASAFLKEFFEADVAPSKRLKDSGVRRPSTACASCCGSRKRASTRKE